MGLALHDPSSSLSDLTEHRHLLPGRALTRANKPRISRQKYFNWLDRYHGHLGLDPEAAERRYRELRPHQARQVAILSSTYRRELPSYVEGISGGKVGHRTRQRWAAEVDEGRAVARSNVALPSDACRLRRTPSLERQDAFKDATTVKRRHSVDGDPGDDAELYRLGLLYDDEHERGSGFGLDTIVHRQPLYTTHVRAERRGRKRKADAAAARLGGYDGSLPLDLSFAALADDDAVARYLISPHGEEEAAAGAVDMVIDVSDDDDDDDDPRSASCPVAGTRIPVTQVIYELLDGSPHSLHDIFLPDATDFPDLVLDNDDDDSAQDWAILKDDDDGSNDDKEEIMEEEGEAASNSPDAWIVLG